MPFGNDTIYAQDGDADQIDCGIGDDVVYADAIDTTTNCETLNKGAAAPAGPAPGKAGPGTPGATDTAGALAVKGSMKLRTLLGGKLSVAVPCPAACRVAVTAKAAGRTVAGGKATLLQAGSASVKLKVAKKAKSSLKRAKTLKVTLTATITGADGKPQRLTRSVTLKK